jgi:hypothetical protein
MCVNQEQLLIRREQLINVFFARTQANGGHAVGARG